MSTSFRMLQLLSLLQTHRYWPGAELAERLEVSARTLRRDVDRLRDLGYPVKADRGVGGGYQLAPGAALPPLVLDDDEAVAIAVGLQTAAQGSVTGIEESSLRALTKVAQIMPARLRRRVDALLAMTVLAPWSAYAASTVDADVLTTLAQACRDGERVSFTYAAGGGDRSDRDVEPHRLVSLGRRWYLVAYDLIRHDWRSVRIDRLTGPRRTGTSFRPRHLPAADAAAFVRAGIDNLPTRYAVDIKVYAPAATVRPELGRWGAVEPVDDESCLLHMSTDTLGWAALAVGTVGADFDVLGPPELVGYLGDWARRFTRASTGWQGIR